MTFINIPATETTPSIVLDPDASILRIEGESYPEDVVAFYSPVVLRISQYLGARPPALTVQIALRYLNTSSSKALLDILLLLDDHHRAGEKVAVEWHYDPAVEVMHEAGEEFGEDLALPYRLVQIGGKTL